MPDKTVVIRIRGKRKTAEIPFPRSPLFQQTFWSLHSETTPVLLSVNILLFHNFFSNRHRCESDLLFPLGLSLVWLFNRERLLCVVPEHTIHGAHIGERNSSESIASVLIVLSPVCLSA